MITAIILAGQRDGRVDPLAAEKGISHKCLVPVAGRPMIVHVVEALAAARHALDIRISIDDPAVLSRVPEIARLVTEGRLTIVEARPNLVDSVIDGIGRTGFPALVTTADNVLLTPAAIEAMIAQGRYADIAVGVATRASVLAAHSDGQRRFYRFSDNAYSNCNIYWIGSAAALMAAEVFRQGGQFAKHPMRIVRAFGIGNLVRFRFGLGTLSAAFARFSQRFGLSIDPVILADGAIAIDADNARTLAIAEQLLEARQPTAIAAE